MLPGRQAQVHPTSSHLDRILQHLPGLTVMRWIALLVLAVVAWIKRPRG
jgi:hypothetical protein